MLYLLKDTVRKIFKYSKIYANYETKDELLFTYLVQGAVLMKRNEFYYGIFLPIKFRTEIYWKDHFGIIGVDESMVIDSIALY